MHVLKFANSYETFCRYHHHEKLKEMRCDACMQLIVVYEQQVYTIIKKS